MVLKKVVFVAFCFLVLIACDNKEKTHSGLQKCDFQKEIDGQSISLFVLKNDNGMEACVTNFGARLVSLMAPDREGHWEDVVCGYSNIDDYLNNKQNFGATIGRYIGRILNSTFTLDSITYHLQPNTGVHCAHGGNPGFANQIWTAEQNAPNSLKLSLLSPDGDNGFPGNLRVDITYTLTNKNELDIAYQATTDKPTVINLSHHSFFNISGNLNSSVEDQLLYINAKYLTPYDSLKCVTGEFMEINNTPFDFTTLRLIGDRIDEADEQLKVVGGYDHNWVLDTNGDLSELAAKVVDEKSGRTLEVYTNEPGLQVYTSNGLKGNLIGKNKIAYHKRTSICLETQHYPDSPNKPQFPSTTLRPGEVYNSRCVYRFGVISYNE